MPCMTPVCSSGPPESRARMRDCLGPALSSTPRISTWNSSIWLPENTVLPVPRMPGWMSLNGKNAVCAETTVASARTTGSRKRGTQPLYLRQLAHFAQLHHHVPLVVHEKCRRKLPAPNNLVVPVRMPRAHGLAERVVVRFDHYERLHLLAREFLGGLAPQRTLGVDRMDY